MIKTHVKNKNQNQGGYLLASYMVSLGLGAMVLHLGSKVLTDGLTNQATSEKDVSMNVQYLTAMHWSQNSESLRSFLIDQGVFRRRTVGIETPEARLDDQQRMTDCFQGRGQGPSNTSGPNCTIFNTVDTSGEPIDTPANQFRPDLPLNSPTGTLSELNAGFTNTGKTTFNDPNRIFELKTLIGVRCPNATSCVEVRLKIQTQKVKNGVVTSSNGRLGFVKLPTQTLLSGSTIKNSTNCEQAANGGSPVVTGLNYETANGLCELKNTTGGIDAANNSCKTNISSSSCTGSAGLTNSNCYTPIRRLYSDQTNTGSPSDDDDDRGNNGNCEGHGSHHCRGNGRYLSSQNPSSNAPGVDRCIAVSNSSSCPTRGFSRLGLVNSSRTCL